MSSRASSKKLPLRVIASRARAGSTDGFGYSGALKASTVVWEEETLSEWLLNPKKFIKARRRLHPLKPPSRAHARLSAI